MRRATDGDRVIDRADRPGNQAISGKSPGLLARSRADLHAAVSRKCREDYQCSGEHNQYFPFHGHANRKSSPVGLSPRDCCCAGVFGENAEADLPDQTAGAWASSSYASNLLATLLFPHRRLAVGAGHFERAIVRRISFLR